jgi:hypothetical protein
MWAVVGWLPLAMVIGCTVDQTQEARAPDVDVDAGRWPQYEVNWADIDVGTSERTITVPVVRIEKESRQITVPFIDINPPGARERDERAISIDVDVPHAGYELQIAEVRASGDDLWVVGSLRQTGTPAAQEMTRLSDRVVINAPEDLDIRKVVVGERPSLAENEQLRFIASMDDLKQIIPDGARVLYRRNPLVGVKGA